MKPATESSSTPAAPRRGAWVPQALIWVGIALAAVMSGVFLYRAATGYLLDVGVFRDAGRAFAEGWGLYGEDFPSRSGFAFLYPPFAALLFVPLTWVGETAMQVLWTVATIAAIYAILAMAATRLGARRPAFIAAGLSGPALAIEPIVSHMFFGQINVFLMLLVAVDVLGFTPHRLRGVGIGVAAGIKITPAAYAIVYLVRRDWGGVWRSAGAFFVTALIGAATAPEQAWRFWTEEFFILDRAGGPGFPPNQAITGPLTRAGMDPDLAAAIMGPGLIVFALLAMWAAYRLLAAGRRVETMLVTVLAVSLSAPVAVTHHWAGIIVAFPLLFLARDTIVRVAAGIVGIVNLVPFYEVYDDEQAEFAFQPLQWLVGNLQSFAGLAAFVLLLVAARRAAAPPLREFFSSPAPTPAEK